jgi:hypothetical protein
MRCLLFAALALLMAAGCSYGPSQAPIFYGPSQAAIFAAQQQNRQPGTIAVGDTMPYVRAQWGDPYQVDRSTYADMSSEWWTYCGYGKYGCAEIAYVHFVDGKVHAIHQ